MKIYWIVDGSLKVRSVKFSGQKMSNGGDLQPPIHLENRFEALVNVGEESPNVTKHGSNQPAANIATNKTLEVKQTAALSSERSRAQDSDIGRLHYQKH